jgi:iron complex transport system ATP-binding protein
MIQLDGVTKRYGDTTVVDDVSLTIPSGGVTSVVGANGAGKSTLLSLMSRLSKPDAGTITVAGLDVATTPTEDLAKRLAVLRQENHTAVRLTVRELVAFGRFPHSGGRLGPTAPWTLSRAGNGNAPTSRWCCARAPTTCCSTSR